MATAEKLKLWAYNKETEKFSCRFPGCPYEHHDPGGVNLHHHKKHGPNASRQTVPASTSRNEQEQSTRSDKKAQKSELSHEWRLLSRANEDELRAIRGGYKEICDDCEGLR